MSKLSGSKVIGITGTMGSGKSTVTSILSKHIPTTDCDQLNARLLEKDQPGYLELKKQNLLYTDENLNTDKQQMASRMFTDSEYKKQCEAILHPLILQAMKDWIADQTGLCAVEVPLLFELGLENEFDEVWCVSCSLPVALERLSSKRNVDPQEARRRLAAQLSPAEKEAKSQKVFYNNGTVEELERNVLQALEEIPA